MIELLILAFYVFSVVVGLWFVVSVLLIPSRISEIRDLVECIDKKMEKLQKTRKNNDS